MSSPLRQTHQLTSHNQINESISPTNKTSQQTIKQPIKPLNKPPINRRLLNMTSSPPLTIKQPIEMSNILPADFRPGRLSALDVVARIFPNQKRSVLDLVLQGCNGDVVKAIEHFLSINDAMLLHQNHSGQSMSAFSEAHAQRRREIEAMAPLLGSLKSAFTPINTGLSPPSLFNPRNLPQAPPPPPPFLSNMFPSAYHRDFAPPTVPYSNASAIHYLFHPGTPFTSGAASQMCSSGCTQCTNSSLIIQNQESTNSLSAFKEVRTATHETAVDLSTEASSWRSSPSSSGSKCTE